MSVATSLATAIAASALATLPCAPAFAQKTFDMVSGSMEPTIHVKQQITANLFAYAFAVPARGDVVVFMVPAGAEFRIYRVVAVPGDTIAYDAHRQLSLNGALVPRSRMNDAPPAPWTNAQVYVEEFPGARHRVMLEPASTFTPTFPELARNPACTTAPGTFTCKMPDGQYFLMGDNREHAQDSRFLGFIPAEYITARVSSGDSVGTDASH